MQDEYWNYVSQKVRSRSLTQIDLYALKYPNGQNYYQQAGSRQHNTSTSIKEKILQQKHDLEDILLAIRKLREGLVASRRMDALTVHST